MERRAGRPKAGQERLTRELITGAALRLIDEEGMGALSMRRLAAELGVDPMAIYHHLPGKAAVVTGVVEAVFAELRVPPPGDKGWQDGVRAFARAYRGVAAAHPHLVLYLVTNAEAAAAATLEATEALYAALEAGGLPPAMVVRAADVVVDYVTGFALAETARPLGEPGDRRELLDQLQARPVDQLPSLRRVFSGLTEDELGGDFDFGLDVILAGIDAVGRGGGTSARGDDGAA